jgi:hypothetical protein
VLHSATGTSDAPTQYSARFEYQFRAIRPVASVRFRGRPFSVFAADEVFFGLSPVARGVTIDQNRVVGGVGLLLSAGERVEIGYLHQWIANTRYSTSEVNHVLQVVFVHSLSIR